jgi:hypothetical protein
MSEDLNPELEDWSDCFVSFEQSKANLEAIEKQLGERLGLTGDIRVQLIALDRSNNLAEDSLVQDWHGALCAYLNDLEHQDKT